MPNIALLQYMKRPGEPTSIAIAGPVQASLWRSLLSHPQPSAVSPPTNLFFM